MLALLICAAVLVVCMDIESAARRRRNKKKQKKGKIQKRNVERQKQNTKVSVEQTTDGTSERGEHSGSAEGGAWEMEQKQTDDALVLEELEEVV